MDAAVLAAKRAGVFSPLREEPPPATGPATPPHPPGGGKPSAERLSAAKGHPDQPSDANISGNAPPQVIAAPEPRPTKLKAVEGPGGEPQGGNTGKPDGKGVGAGGEAEAAAAAAASAAAAARLALPKKHIAAPVVPATPERTVWLPEDGQEHRTGQRSGGGYLGHYLPTWAHSAGRKDEAPGSLAETTPICLPAGHYAVTFQIWHKLTPNEQLGEVGVWCYNTPRDVSIRGERTLLGKSNLNAQTIEHSVKGGYQRQVLFFSLPDPATEPVVTFEVRHNGRQSFNVGAITLTPLGDSNGLDGRRPFLIIASQIQTSLAADRATNQGKANAIESKVHPTRTDWGGIEFYADYYEPFSSFLKNLSLLVELDELALVMLTCESEKVPALEFASYLSEALQEAKLPAKNVVLRVSEGDMETFHSVLYEGDPTREGSTQYRCGLDTTSVDVAKRGVQPLIDLAEQGPANFIGLTAPPSRFRSLNPWLPKLMHLSNCRDKNGRMRKVYFGVVDDPISIQNCLDYGVDGVFTTQPRLVWDAIHAHPFKKILRPAGKNDSQFHEHGFGYDHELLEAMDQRMRHQIWEFQQGKLTVGGRPIPFDGPQPTANPGPPRPRPRAGAPYQPSLSPPTHDPLPKSTTGSEPTRPTPHHPRPGGLDAGGQSLAPPEPVGVAGAGGSLAPHLAEGGGVWRGDPSTAPATPSQPTPHVFVAPSVAPYTGEEGSSTGLVPASSRRRPSITVMTRTPGAEQKLAIPDEVDQSLTPKSKVLQPRVTGLEAAAPSLDSLRTRHQQLIAEGRVKSESNDEKDMGEEAPILHGKPLYHLPRVTDDQPPMPVSSGTNLFCRREEGGEPARHIALPSAPLGSLECTLAGQDDAGPLARFSARPSAPLL